ncbi:MAG: ankyrin repeat domain-containing protein [Nitrospirae bacterium]|nr:ankyrin repeat domain-containing protein [Nitrospirota bacterium]
MVWTTFFFLTDQPPAWSAPRVSDADVNGDAVSVVREKLDQGADPDETDRNGKSLLFMAASRGETRMVRLLLHYGASPDHPDISGKTPLYQAASNGYTEIVRLLLAHGADPNRRDGEGSPLEWAIANKHEKIVEILKHWTRIRRRYLLRKLPLFLNLVPPSQRLRLEKGPLLATGSLPYALPPGLLTAPWKTRHSFVKEATEADIEARTSRFGGNGKEPLWRRRAIEEIAKNLKGYRAVH